jgi:AraC-like DNA-binding protein
MSSPLLIGLYAIVLFQLLLLAIFLIVAKKEKQRSNRILAALFLWLAINITDGMLSYSNFYQEHTAWAHVEDGFIFLLGPLLYFYTLSVVYKQFAFVWRDALHLIPFVVTTISFQVYYHSRPEEFQKLIQEAIVRQDLPFEFYFTISLVYLHIAMYIAYALKAVAKYRRLIRDQFAAVNKINLDWLVFMLISISIILTLSAGLTFLPVFGLSGVAAQSLVFPFAALITFTSLIFWKAWRQPQLFLGIDAGIETKYTSSSLSSDEKEQIANRLRLCMSEQKPFLNPDLSIDQLSDLVKTTTRKTSQVINETFQQNYFDFVNSYRIEEAQRILTNSDDGRLTVLEVMYQCGFNSKSSFNTLFRKKTGQTPSQFRRSKQPT